MFKFDLMKTLTIYTEKEPTNEQLEAMHKANEILQEVELELIGTRPKKRV